MSDLEESGTRSAFKTVIPQTDEYKDMYTSMVEWLWNIDMFLYDISGYWARSVRYNSSSGWLLFENGEDYEEDAEKAAIAAWEKNQPLPKGYYQLNAEIAQKAVDIGIARYGIGFIEGDADGFDIDTALQLAILGEVVYC